MPEIDRNKLSAKLDTIPQQDREPYLQALKAKGYTWKTNQPPAAPQQPPSAIAQAFQKAVGALTPTNEFKQMLNASPPARALQGIADIGKFAQSGYEQAGQLIGKTGIPGAQTVGKLLPAATDLILPQSKAQVAMLPVMAAGEMASALSKTPQAIEQAATKAVRPGPIAKGMGALMSITTAIPTRYTSAVAKDASILADTAPTIEQVGKEYTALFDKLGMQYPSALLKKVTSRGYFPGENETGKLTALIEDANKKLEAGKLDPAGAFLARSAAAAIQRGNAAAKNMSLAKYAGEAKNAMDNYLEQNGIPEIRELSTKYFRAVAKEYFQPLFPQNKNMSPNAIRSLIALKKAVVDPVSHIAQGQPLQAAGSALQGLAMSPLIVGGAVKTAGNLIGNPNVQAKTTYAAMKIPTALRRFLKKQVPQPDDNPNP